MLETIYYQALNGRMFLSITIAQYVEQEKTGSSLLNKTNTHQPKLVHYYAKRVQTDKGVLNDKDRC